jgi:hypothetical protein
VRGNPARVHARHRSCGRSPEKDFLSIVGIRVDADGSKRPRIETGSKNDFSLKSSQQVLQLREDRLASHRRAKNSEYPMQKADKKL